MKYQLITALKDKLLGERAVVLVEINLMLENPRVIPEHTNFMAELESKFATLAEIQDKLQAVDLYDNPEPEYIIQTRER